MSANAGVNTALLAALPEASNVLELGCATGLLGERYKASHPGSRWVGVDVNDHAVRVAAERLDETLLLDLDRGTITSAGTGYDLIVMGDVLEHLKRPEQLLADLHAVATDDAQIACCIPNLSHLSVLERAIAGDVMYDDAGLLDRTHLRYFSPRSVFKMFLDSGWLPTVAGGYRGAHSNAAFLEAIHAAAQALGISRQASEYNVETYQLVVRAKRWNAERSAPAVDITAVVPVTNDLFTSLNATRSPALSELGAKVLHVRNATSAAEALAHAASQSDSPWFLVLAQDTYIPAGSGYALARFLSTLSGEGGSAGLVGFAGTAATTDAPVRAGTIVEGQILNDYPGAKNALTINDAAVVVHRSCIAAVDSNDGWTGWATALCRRGERASIVRAPVFSNRST